LRAPRSSNPRRTVAADDDRKPHRAEGARPMIARFAIRSNGEVCQMKFDVAPWVTQLVTSAVDTVTHSWPYVVTAAAIAGGAWRSWNWFLEKVAYGVTKVQLKDQRDEARREFRRSELMRTSLRAMVDDLTRSLEEQTRLYDEQSRLHEQRGRDLQQMRERLIEIDAMLESKTANEYILFQDRERAIAWGRAAVTSLAALGQPTTAEPQMLGVPVAEPEAVITERLTSARESLHRQVATPPTSPTP
jgi:hypothetical protein